VIQEINNVIKFRQQYVDHQKWCMYMEVKSVQLPYQPRMQLDTNQFS